VQCLRGSAPGETPRRNFSSKFKSISIYDMVKPRLKIIADEQGDDASERHGRHLHASYLLRGNINKSSSRSDS
jgi:hypothetical protein